MNQDRYRTQHEQATEMMLKSIRTAVWIVAIAILAYAGLIGLIFLSALNDGGY